MAEKSHVPGCCLHIHGVLNAQHTNPSNCSQTYISVIESELNRSSLQAGQVGRTKETLFAFHAWCSATSKGKCSLLDVRFGRGGTTRDVQKLFQTTRHLLNWVSVVYYEDGSKCLVKPLVSISALYPL